MISTDTRRDVTARQELRQPKEALPGKPSMLVAIASYGTGQDHFLAKVIAEFRKLDTPCRIVVLSNLDKPVPGAEVLVGLPSRDTYSLPFAHRKLFRENVDNYDLFVYTEDDTLITARNIRAFLEVQEQLADGEIAGLLRSETDPHGKRYIVSANHHFRWLPDTVVSRGSHRFAQFSNQHSGCFVATRAQLSRAIASGGFTSEPRAGRYGMLETAASDIYTQCGLKRIICLTRIEDFIVPHLANKYHGSMGVAIDDFQAQVECVSTLADAKGRPTSLFNPEARAPGFRWSKHLYREPDDALLDLMPSLAHRVLSIGAACGGNEVELLRRGYDVRAVPLDPVFGDQLSRRGVQVHAGPFARMSRMLGAAEFDAILAADVLHLIDDPLEALRAMSDMLAPGGQIVGSVSNTASLLWLMKDWRRGRRWVRPGFTANGAHPMSRRRLARLCRLSSLQLLEVRPTDLGSSKLLQVAGRLTGTSLAPGLLFRARRRG